ncbi:Uncharacterised protein [Klebsiella pneumoniae]|nr:Uncharacterised protein [Klebsiella pneumoniae]
MNKKSRKFVFFGLSYRIIFKKKTFAFHCGKIPAINCTGIVTDQTYDVQAAGFSDNCTGFSLPRPNRRASHD